MLEGTEEKGEICNGAVGPTCNSTCVMWIQVATSMGWKCCAELTYSVDTAEHGCLCLHGSQLAWELKHSYGTCVSLHAVAIVTCV